MIFLVRPLGIHCKRVLNVMASSKNKRPSGKVYLQVLGTSTVDTSASLLLFTDSQRYIFNCGEGTQRIFNEYKLRFTRLTNIFFTRVCWEYIGGLPGMAMTLRDNGKSDIGVYGPTTLSDFIKATRFFLHCEKLNFDCIGFAGEKDEKYEDENLTIWPVVLNKIRKETLSLAKETVVDKSCTMSRSLESSSASNKAEEPSRKRWKSDDNSAVLCYICQLATLPGKFLPEKAKQLGVPRGPLFGELHSGKTVTLKDGTQIHPEQVMEAAQPGPVFMIVDCPSVEYVLSLVTNDLFSQHWMDGCKPAPVVIVHLTPLELFQHHPEYTEWRKRFGDNVTHLLINNDVCGSPLVFQSQATIQCKLHTIAPDIFPLLYSTEIPAFDNKGYSLPTNCFPGENCLKFHLRPSRKQGLDMSDKPDVLDVKSIITETQVLLGIKTERDKQGDTNLALTTGVVKETRTFSTSSFCGSSEPISESKQISRILQAVGACCSENSNGMSIKGSMESKADKKDFGVVFIGTGAAIPSKYRNVSSTLINMSEHRSLLLDCGEGTYGQLYRHYGKSLDFVLQQISCVFISHIHADHHLGLIQILQQREKHKYSQGPPLLVVGPKKIQMWLHEYNNWCEDIDYRFVDSAELAHPSIHCHHVQDVLSELEASEVKTVPVIHCPEAYGLVLTHRTGWKLVYSGDTRPCAKLIEAGTGADLLIHEATLEDDLTAEALEKMHSTTTEAIESGLKMGAKFIMLNHFSQRYPKIPVFSEQFTKHTGIAFDHMKVRSSNFSTIPELLDPLKIIFSEEIDEMKKAT